MASSTQRSRLVSTSSLETQINADNVIDHVNPLACGGPDAPSNMQLQTIVKYYGLVLVMCSQNPT
jgi:hypothetical protein